jgi:DNA polymerase elongation subunit (family B)
MFTTQDLEELLFIDIETVCKYKTYEEFLTKEPKLASLFDVRMDSFLKEDEKSLSKEERYFKKSSLFPEFSKILTISFGIIRYDQETQTYKKYVNNIIDRDEKVVLEKFGAVLNKATLKNKSLKFCGHNIDAFDIPFIIKRMLINDIKLPNKLILHKFKPWDYPTIDTMKIWKFGSFEWTSLDTVCTVMGITSPKTEDVNNKIISELFYSDDPDSLNKIYKYCNDDVHAVMNLMLKFSVL